MQSDDFEWDDEKSARNLRVHKVTFEAASEVFADVFAVQIEDRREDYGEHRYAITGMAQGRLLFVAYTYRENRIRIISARHAKPFEKRLYHEQNAEE